MAKNKTTLKDIAKECNVSVATVSYVLNHSDKENISHVTRLKVSETATRLHYTPPNKISDKKEKLIGIIISLKGNDSSTKKAIYYDLAIELSNKIKAIGFESTIILTTNIESDSGIIAKHNLTAMFIIDVDNNSIKKITNKYFVPVIFLNCDVNDSLFFRVFPDFENLYNIALEIFNTYSLFIVIEDICNQNIKENINEFFQTKDIFINTVGADLKLFAENHKKHCGIIMGDYLGLEAERFFDSSKMLVVSNLENRNMFLPETNVVLIKNSFIAEIAVSNLKNMLQMGCSTSENNCLKLKATT